jgi:hypothetical protein
MLLNHLKQFACTIKKVSLLKNVVLAQNKCMYSIKNEQKEAFSGKSLIESKYNEHQQISTHVSTGQKGIQNDKCVFI